MTSNELHAYEEALEDVENPCAHSVGAPGSAKQRANDLGLEVARLRADNERLRELASQTWNAAIDAALVEAYGWDSGEPIARDIRALRKPDPAKGGT